MTRYSCATHSIVSIISSFALFIVIFIASHGPAAALDENEWQETTSQAQSLIQERKIEEGLALVRAKTLAQTEEPGWHMTLGAYLMRLGLSGGVDPASPYTRFAEEEKELMLAIDLFGAQSKAGYQSQCYYYLAQIQEEGFQSRERAVEYYRK